MRSKHREMTFDVHQQTSEKWEWVVFPKIEKGSHFGGVSPTEAEATVAARQGIDEWLAQHAGR